MSIASAVRTRFARAEPPCRPVPAAPGDLDNWAGSPRHPDALVFGPPGSGELQAARPPDPMDFRPHRHCACGAGWRGDEACWNCGPAATET